MRWVKLSCFSIRSLNQTPNVGEHGKITAELGIRSSFLFIYYTPNQGNLNAVKKNNSEEIPKCKRFLKNKNKIFVFPSLFSFFDFVGCPTVWGFSGRRRSQRLLRYRHASADPNLWSHIPLVPKYKRALRQLAEIGE